MCMERFFSLMHARLIGRSSYTKETIQILDHPTRYQCFASNKIDHHVFKRMYFKNITVSYKPHVIIKHANENH